MNGLSPFEISVMVRRPIKYLPETPRAGHGNMVPRVYRGGL